QPSLEKPPQVGHRPAHRGPELLLVDMVNEEDDRGPPSEQWRRKGRDAAVHVEDDIRSATADPISGEPGPHTDVERVLATTPAHLDAVVVLRCELSGVTRRPELDPRA